MTFKSPLINVIHSGINKFSRKILRDFGEIESLQLSHDRLDKFSNKSFDYIKNTLENYFLKCRPDWKIHIYNENDNEVNFETDRFYWLIETINGVQNFKRGIPFFSVNIAVCKNDETVASSIYDPVRDEFYFTEKGKGAYLNGKRIRVSNRMNIDETLFSINLDIVLNSCFIYFFI